MFGAISHIGHNLGIPDVSIQRYESTWMSSCKAVVSEIGTDAKRDLGTSRQICDKLEDDLVRTVQLMKLQI